MRTPERVGDKEKGSPSVSSLPTPPKSAEKPSPKPLSSTNLSLSPPIQRAIEIFKSIKHGNRPDGSWVKLRLEPGDFPRLKEQLEADDDLWGYIQDKIRFDYDPDANEIVFRMNTGTHEIFTARVVEEIISRRQQAQADISRPDIAAIARDINFDAHTSIELRGVNSDESYGHRSPDAAFRHNDARYPSIVIETSFSQKRKDLPRLADHYIPGSYGNIKMVIGLDIEYRNSKRATVSVWESDMGLDEDGTPYLRAKKTVDDESFRNDDSSPASSGASLHFPISAFVNQGTAPNPLPSDAAISIPYATLYTFLEHAERSHQKVKGLGYMIEPPPGLKRVWRPSTPEEQLEDDDKARFAASEDEAERKAYKEDGAWGRIFPTRISPDNPGRYRQTFEYDWNVCIDNFLWLDLAVERQVVEHMTSNPMGDDYARDLAKDKRKHPLYKLAFEESQERCNQESTEYEACTQGDKSCSKTATGGTIAPRGGAREELPKRPFSTRDSKNRTVFPKGPQFAYGSGDAQMFRRILLENTVATAADCIGYLLQMVAEASGRQNHWGTWFEQGLAEQGPIWSKNYHAGGTHSGKAARVA
ncbi:MAG: hypothetical protein M1839_004180 [Geoglossum umbratile]|nr:MAG: hypothetical protein M1839_004180 [Geoglossum umbratile]